MIENHNERLLNQLRQHPQREPRAEIKNRLKTNLREKAQIMDRKQSFYPVLKIAGVSLASVFIIILLVSSAMAPIKNSMNLLLGTGGGVDPSIVDEEDDENGTIEEPTQEINEELINELPFMDIREDLVKFEVWEDAAETLVLYLEAVFEKDLEGVEIYSFIDYHSEDDYLELIQFYDENVRQDSLKVLDVQFSLGEPDVLALISYKDGSGEEKAVWYVISHQGDTGHLIYDTIQSQHDESAFQVTEKIRGVYEKFAESYDIKALFGLTAEEFVTLYFFVDRLGDYETLYELHILDEEKYVVVDREQYLEEMRDVNARSLADSIEDELLAMYQVYMGEASNDGYVRLIFKDEPDFPLTFRLTFEEGVWKSHWHPLQ